MPFLKLLLRYLLRYLLKFPHRQAFVMKPA